MHLKLILKHIKFQIAFNICAGVSTDKMILFQKLAFFLPKKETFLEVPKILNIYFS